MILLPGRVREDGANQHCGHDEEVMAR
jgi:hypothetical protein